MTQYIILLAALMGFCLTGCGDVSASKSESALKLRGSKTSMADKTANRAAPNKPVVAKKASGITPEAKAVKPLGHLLDINEAAEAQFLRVPGLTPEIQKLIKDTRPFLDMAEFDDMLSFLDVSSKARKALYGHVFIVIDINNSPTDDIEFVPGLSNNVVHKIQSGRPYKNLSALKSVLEKSRQSEDADYLIKYFKVAQPKK